MKRCVFASRNLKELMRDPLSYVFCLGFPIVMLLIMSIVNDSIPAEVNMTIFNINNLSAGVAVFGFTFIMLFMALQVSKDMSGAFLTRLYVSPMKAADYVIGYTIPMLFTAIVQCVITLAVSYGISIYVDDVLEPLNLLYTVIVFIPSEIMFLGFGLLFGSMFNDKAAPGLCSIIITLASMLGGIWMDVDGLGGTLAKVCKVLPFYHCVKSGVCAVNGVFEKMLPHIAVIGAWAVGVYLVAILAFAKKMKRDK